MPTEKVRIRIHMEGPEQLDLDRIAEGLSGYFPGTEFEVLRVQDEHPLSHPPSPPLLSCPFCGDEPTAERWHEGGPEKTTSARPCASAT